jgi:transposase, IS6 family
VSYGDLEQMVGEHGNTIDFYRSPTRDTAAAKRFPGNVLNSLKDREKLKAINTEKAPAYAAVIAEVKKEGKCPEETPRHQIKYLNKHHRG